VVIAIDLPGGFIPTPQADTILLPGDRLFCYGVVAQPEASRLKRLAGPPWSLHRRCGYTTRHLQSFKMKGDEEMAKPETKNVQEQTGEHQKSQQQAAQGSSAIQTGGKAQGLARRGSYFPSVFSLTPRDLFTAGPFELMRRFSDEMDRMFEDFGLANWSTSQVATWSPAIEVLQRGGNLVIRADLPGLKKEDVKVELTDDGIIIQGERSQDHEEKREGYFRSERSYGRFYRLIPLPENVNPQQVQASFNNGVLEVTLPIPQSQQRKHEIPIQTGGSQQAASAGQGQKR